MKILLIEDQACFYEDFIKELSSIAEVVHFKGSNAARRYLFENEATPPDIIICDHHILRFEEETHRKATGDEIYHDLRMSGNMTTPFLHFSSDPCPQEYNTQGDKHFYFKKKGNISPLQWLKDLKLV